MSGTSRIPAALLLLSLLLGCAGGSDDAETHADPAAEVAKTTLVHAGDPAPALACALLDGGRFDLAEHRGRVVLVNFFATWCPPCIAEMTHLKSKVWERFAGEDFVLISVAREEDAEVVAPFAARHGMTWPVGLDPDRSNYARYAGAYIPRNFVIDREGQVAYQAQGFEEAEFAAMTALLERLLGGS